MRKKKTAEEYFNKTPLGFLKRINDKRGFQTMYTYDELISFANSYAKYFKIRVRDKRKRQLNKDS